MARYAPCWTDTTHWDLTDIAALRMGLASSRREVLRDNVLIMDQWGILDKIRHYMPLSAMYADRLTGEAIEASRVTAPGTLALGMLGQAMHLLQDSGNPWHAKPLLPFYQRNHTVFEEYVAKNMREGFCFRRVLLDTPQRWILPGYTQRIGDGAGHLAREAAGHFAFLDRSIRLDAGWQEDEGVARVTSALLLSCLRMCETQIQCFLVRATTSMALPVRLPVGVTWTFFGPEHQRLLGES